jgi:uncharacterized membrane protein affecting hemolysin expression
MWPSPSQEAASFAATQELSNILRKVCVCMLAACRFLASAWLLFNLRMPQRNVGKVVQTAQHYVPEDRARQKKKDCDRE